MHQQQCEAGPACGGGCAKCRFLDPSNSTQKLQAYALQEDVKVAPLEGHPQPVGRLPESAGRFRGREVVASRTMRKKRQTIQHRSSCTILSKPMVGVQASCETCEPWQPGHVTKPQTCVAGEETKKPNWQRPAVRVQGLGHPTSQEKATYTHIIYKPVGF